MTNPDILKLIEAQTDGLFRRSDSRPGVWGIPNVRLNNRFLAELAEVRPNVYFQFDGFDAMDAIRAAFWATR